ncbi:hypothetical protein [Micromonospora craterilacus]|uniref:hypothetical protein n=1 Tax=Micromonospora craterilacus TaxID=1655439 RepID=UPI0011B4B43D|nr:hypothetical protein [Micromonospora craterilacus]
MAHGSERFAALLAQLRADTALVRRFWAEAEGTPDELDKPGTLWSVVVLRDGSRWGTLAAWAAARVEGDTLKCFANYEVPGVGRELGLYRVAYQERHRAVVLPSRRAAVTFLFAQPIPLHEADGWRRTGLQGVSTEPGIEAHAWWELRRDPTEA